MASHPEVVIGSHQFGPRLCPEAVVAFARRWLHFAASPASPAGGRREQLGVTAVRALFRTPGAQEGAHGSAVAGSSQQANRLVSGQRADVAQERMDAKGRARGLLD